MFIYKYICFDTNAAGCFPRCVIAFKSRTPLLVFMMLVELKKKLEYFCFMFKCIVVNKNSRVFVISKLSYTIMPKVNKLTSAKQIWDWIILTPKPRFDGDVFGLIYSGSKTFWARGFRADTLWPQFTFGS